MLRHLTIGLTLLGLLTSAGCDKLKIQVQNSEVRHRNSAKAWLIFSRKKDKWEEVPTDHKNTVRWRSSLDGEIGQGIVMERDNLSIGTHKLSISGDLKDPKSGDMKEAKPKNNGDVSLTVRNTKPVVSVLSPSNSMEVGLGQQVHFNVSANDAGEDGQLSGASIVWTSSQPPYQLGTGTSVTRSDLDGSQERTLHVITVRATDSGGASQTETVLLTVVNERPEVTISEPAAAKTIKVMETLSLSGSAIDPDAQSGNGAIAASSLSWSSSIDGFLGTGQSLSRSDLSGGVHTITLRAKDATGVTGSASVQVEVLNQRPIVTLNQPTGDRYSVTDSIQFAASASDPDGAAIDPNKVVWTSNRDGQLGVGLSLSPRSLSGGVHTLSVSATDAHGGLTSTSKTVEVVNLDPIVSLDSPRNNDRFSVKDRIRFRVSASDPDGLSIRNEDIRWTADGRLIGRGAELNEALTPGTYSISVSVTDVHGGTTVDKVVIDVTNSAPTVEIDSPNASSFASSKDTVRFRADVRDADDNVADDDVVWSSDKDGELHRGASFESDKLSPGQHEIMLKVKDAYNETAFDTVRILITNEEPTAMIRRPQQGAEFKHGDSLRLRAMGTDLEDGVLSDAAFTWTLSKIGQGQGGHGHGHGNHGDHDFGQQGPSITGQSKELPVARILRRRGAGTYMLILTVTDSDGATATDRRRIKLINEAPTELKVFTSATGPVTAGDAITFTASARDPETGLLADGNLRWQARQVEQGQPVGQPIALGNGSTLQKADLAPGRYRVFLIAVDPHDENLTARSEALVIVVKPKPQPQPQADSGAATGGAPHGSGAATVIDNAAGTGSHGPNNGN